MFFLSYVLNTFLMYTFTNAVQREIKPIFGPIDITNNLKAPVTFAIGVF